MYTWILHRCLIVAHALERAFLKSHSMTPTFRRKQLIIEHDMHYLAASRRFWDEKQFDRYVALETWAKLCASDEKKADEDE